MTIRATAGLVVLIAVHLAWAPAVRAQDPSGVYGYIAFVDPTTGERWIPVDDRGNLLGYPSEISVVFRSRTDSREHRAAFENWAGTMRLGDAVKYEVVFNYTTVPGQLPTALGRAPGATGPRQIQYNPAAWRFDRVEVGPWRFAGGIGSAPIPLTRRATPFPSLP